MKLTLADLKVQFDCKYDYTEKVSRDYLTEFDTPDVEFSVTEQEIDRENDEKANFNRGYLESLALYRKLAEKIPEHNGVLMHGVLIEVDGEGIIFTAESGVGKSTHAAMWLRLLGVDRCKIVNGDKPLLRFVDGKLYAYGTPWCGKEFLQQNKRVELKSIAFIERGSKNETFEVSANECFQELVNQTHFPAGDINRILTLDVCGKIMEKVNFYKIKCTPDVEAAKVAYNKIFNK